MTEFSVIAGSARTPPIRVEGGKTLALNSLVGVANDVEVAGQLWQATNAITLPNATCEQVVDAIDEQRAEAKAGDTFLFYFSGHGIRLKDEAGTYSEALGCSDGLLLDSYLRLGLHKFPVGVMAIAVIDACHAAGLVFVDRPRPADKPLPILTRAPIPGATSTLLSIAACHESAEAAQVYAAGGDAYGQLTASIVQAAADKRAGTWAETWDSLSRWAQGSWDPHTLPVAQLTGPVKIEKKVLDAAAFIPSKVKTD